MPRGEVNLDPISTASAGRLRRCGGRIRRHLDRQKRCRIPTRTEAWIAAPEENHVCVQSMPTRHRRDRGTWLQCLSHNTPLERLRVAPSFPFSSVCQNNCPRKISGHDRPQSRQDSHAHHKPIKVGRTGRLRTGVFGTTIVFCGSSSPVTALIEDGPQPRAKRKQNPGKRTCTLELPVSGVFLP